MSALTQWNASAWTQENTQRLKQFAESGLTGGQIVQKFQEIQVYLTRNAVIGKLARMRIPLRAAKGTRVDSNPNRRVRTLTGVRTLKVNVTTRKAPLRSWVDRVPADEPTPLKIPLMQLQPFHCRKVIDGERWSCVCAYNDLALYCGRPVLHDETSYCAYHHARFRVRPRR